MTLNPKYSCTSVVSISCFTFISVNLFVCLLETPAALVKGAGRSVQFRQLQLYRHEMQHFVKVIQGYIANQILQVSWSEFTAKLATASDLDAIHRMHADYLNRAIFR